MRDGFFGIAVGAIAGAVLFLGACSGVSLSPKSFSPFGGVKEQDASRAPAGATTYACEGGARLFVRYLDNGAAAWVILPGREFRLNKAPSGASTRYSNGSATLELKGNELTLFDGAKPTHAGCKSSSG